MKQKFVYAKSGLGLFGLSLFAIGVSFAVTTDMLFLIFIASNIMPSPVKVPVSKSEVEVMPIVFPNNKLIFLITLRF